MNNNENVSKMCGIRYKMCGISKLNPTHLEPEQFTYP